ncbi:MULTISPECIES: biotin synthase auxiliary protein BsaP [unclassified Crossiella]|uniref:biotin synthase auxiliary protein BsaP n=1 Tax=unclassified Crossiella TaxID=2620835 RepID=UPI00207D437F|nr:MULTISPECIES: hypothetical protein [unclassified Crossiella]MCO1582101.1 hypothetical protein [Crossiella sp. SN42]WHT21391.1 hypothetical protein N8J89_10145 [Crossiella sp. CA-258035]
MTLSDTPATALFCDICGKPDNEGEHRSCVARRAIDPPRYCPQCARRMIVQVSPSGWSAKCSAHGSTEGGQGGRL